MGDSSPRSGDLVIGRRSFVGRAIAAIVATWAGAKPGDRPNDYNVGPSQVATSRGWVDVERDLKRRAKRDTVGRMPKRYQVVSIHDTPGYSSQIVPEISPLLKAAGVEGTRGERVTYAPMEREIFFRSEDNLEEVRIIGFPDAPISELDVGDWVWIEHDAGGSAHVL